MMPHGPKPQRSPDGANARESTVHQLRHLDDRILLAINSFARHTPALHRPLLAYATYGVVLFAALLLAGLISARHRSSRDLAATGWAAIAMLLALALNQPLGNVVTERRPYLTHPGILRLADVTTDFSFPSDHAVMAGAVAVGLLLAHRRLAAAAAVAALRSAATLVDRGDSVPSPVGHSPRSLFPQLASLGRALRARRIEATGLSR